MDALERQALLLDAIRRVTLPLVRLLINEGIGYQSFISQMKPVFIEQALAQVQERGEKDTDSALSLRSGIARKDINAWRQNPLLGKKTSKRSIPSEVFTRWISDPVYELPDGQPRKLPRVGPAPSFESLSRSVNQDVHPLSVLNELIRLGLAALESGEHGEEQVGLLNSAFVPQHDLSELLALFVDNLSAHLETATHNLQAHTPARLEQAAYAGGLTPDSAQVLSDLSRQLWSNMLDDFMTEARRLHAQDAGQGTRLVRLGAYFHDGLQPSQPTDS
ncbi:MAG: DUF6502 family protein [Rhodoferax sp.]|nr:DUF6502 family protein [Rhodoferax sp.]